MPFKNVCLAIAAGWLLPAGSLAAPGEPLVESHPPIPGLTLRLELAESATADAVRVRYIVENVGTDVLVLHPSIGLAQQCPRSGPFPTLVVSLHTSSGTPVPSRWHQPLELKVAMPSSDSFLQLATGAFLGGHIELSGDPLNFPLAVSTTYELRAHFCTSARTWLAERIEAGQVDKDLLWFELHQVAEGWLHASAIRFTVGPPALVSP